MTGKYDPVAEIRSLPVPPITLRLGSTGRPVRVLCRVLGQLGIVRDWADLSVPAPNEYTPFVRAAVIRAQQQFGLKDDGICGQLTWTRLAGYDKWPKVLQPVLIPSSDQAEVDLRSRIVSIAQHEVGVREMGRNRGVRVDQYIFAAEGQLGEPWCASFCEWVYENAYSPRKAPFDIGRSVPDLMRRAQSRGRTVQPKDVLPGDLVCVTRADGSGRHVGIATSTVDNGYVKTIEGNTNDNGSAEGDGVYARIRPIKRLVFVRAI